MQDLFLCQAKQELWDSELTPTGKENTDEAKKFVSRSVGAVADTKR